MQRKQFSEEQIIGILKEAEAGAVVADLCRRHGMSSATYYAWKAKFGGLEVWHAVEIASAPTMITDCIFDAPDHRLGTRISSGPPRAMPKFNIVYSVHHR